MSNELSANEVIKIVQELKALERKFGGKEGLLNHLQQINESLNSQQVIAVESKNELQNLFQKLQDSKNLKIEVEKLKLNFVNKEEFHELQKLVNYIRSFKTLLVQKTNEINNAYVQLDHLWFEENEVLKRIEKLEKSFLLKVLFGGMGLGILLVVTVIVILRYLI